jgi:hypothetical protein
MKLHPVSSVPDNSELSSKLVLKRDTAPQMRLFFLRRRLRQCELQNRGWVAGITSVVSVVFLPPVFARMGKIRTDALCSLS